jgi:hypothetical protein
VAVVADSLLEGRFDELRDAGWGVVQLPPAGLDADTAREWLELAAEQIAEYERTGHELVLVDDGTWAPELERVLRELGASLPPSTPSSHHRPGD